MKDYKLDKVWPEHLNLSLKILSCWGKSPEYKSKWLTKLLIE